MPSIMSNVPQARAGGQAPPPQDLQAEQSTLGAMLIERAAVEKAAEIITARDFYRDAHQTLFEVITALTERDEPVDFITVGAELKSRDKLEAIGGETYLMALLDTVPTAANIEHYCKIVKKHSTLRQVWSFAHRLTAQIGGDDVDPDALLERAQTGLSRIASQAGGVACSLAPRKPIKERFVDLADVPPPPAALPCLFGHYILEGEQHILTGATGLGKSTLLYNVVGAIAEGRSLYGIDCQARKVAYVDMETGSVGRSLKVGRLYRDRPRPRGRLLFLEDVRLPEEGRQLTASLLEHGISLVIFDTMRRVFSVKDENDNSEYYARVLPTLDLLKQAGIATLTLAHPAKTGLGGARGAGSQQDAPDVVLNLVMHRGEVTDADGILALKVLKHRLLGLECPDLFLRRVGNDHFEAIAATEAGASGASPETPTPRQNCGAAIVEFLKARPQQHASYNEIVMEMRMNGFGISTAKRARALLEENGDILRATGGGYVLAANDDDPFADDNEGQGSPEP